MNDRFPSAKKKLAAILTLATSLLLSPAANAAGMIVIDPITPGVGRPLPITRPGHTVRPIPGRLPLLHGQVSFGLRLQNADIKVEINDQVAKTYICQTFVNDTDQNLAGTYLFPLPEDTTFSSFSLHIDGKPVEGKILEAQEARTQYEAIVRSMVDPGLLEYADYKTVRARIFPIPARGTKKVELEYTQVLKAENGMIKYRFPMKAEGDSEAIDELKLNVKLNSKQDLRTIWSPTHSIASSREGNHLAKVNFFGKDTLPDKDFLLYYSVSDKDMSANLLNHKKSGEDGYFLLTITPPIQTKQVAAKDLVLVADTSGSMQGERMEQNKKALKYLVNSLNAADRFSIVEFNTDVESFKTVLVQATPENKKAALRFIDDLEARGGTNIGDALKTGVTILESGSERPAYLVLLTDGEPTVGETTVPGILKTVKSKRDVRVFDFGVGYDINTKLLNRLADENHGTTQYIEPNESLEVALANFSEKIKSPVLSNIKLNYQGVQVKDVYPRNVKDLFAGSQLLLIGKYKNATACNVQLTGTVNGVAKTYNFPAKFAESEAGHTYLPRLWAMRRIAHLTDVAQDNGNNKEIVDEIIALSKKYGIISAYTSYLVTDPSENGRLANRPVPVASPMPMSVRESSGLRRDEIMRNQRLARTNQAPSIVGWGDAGGAGGISAMDMRSMGKKASPPSASFGSYISSKADRQRSIAEGKESNMYYQAKDTIYGDDAMVAAKLKASLSSDFDKPVSGQAAVKRAKARNEMRKTELAAKEMEQVAGIKTAGDKTFYMKDGFWTDSALSAKNPGSVKTINFGSKEYFDLVRNNPGISKYLSVGRQVIFNHNGQTYKIVFKDLA